LDRPKARAFTSRGNADPGGPALMVFARMAVAVLAQALVAAAYTLHESPS
jgi:hypothetical protein